MPLQSPTARDGDAGFIGFGRVLSAETIAKRSLAMKGVPKSEAHKEKIRQFQLSISKQKGERMKKLWNERRKYKQ
jgi:hypothetical protein